MTRAEIIASAEANGYSTNGKTAASLNKWVCIAVA